jgi:hypothetical protein
LLWLTLLRGIFTGPIQIDNLNGPFYLFGSASGHDVSRGPVDLDTASSGAGHSVWSWAYNLAF